VVVNEIAVCGWGAVSPAGWGMVALRERLASSEPVPITELARPGLNRPLRVRSVPPLTARPPALAHARLRRTSPIAQYVVSAALEALGAALPPVQNGATRLGIIFCAMAGCVNYSTRFYDETLRDPATASPLVFPETVFNAPASHLAALLDATACNYTLVGDPGAYLQGIALAADWLCAKRVDKCLVVAAEELDWIVAESFHLFSSEGTMSAGAGALCLRRVEDTDSAVRLSAVTGSHPFLRQQTRRQAAASARAELGPDNEDVLLCDGLQGIPRLDHDEAHAWSDWTGARLSVKKLCGEAFMASSAWQCVAAVDALARGVCSAGVVSVVGCNQQAIAARFVRHGPTRQ